MAKIALREPHRAKSKLREWVGTPPAYAHAHVLMSDLPRQYAGLKALRQKEEFLLVVLDACRYDVFADVAPEYLEFARLDPIRSEGHNTFEYVARCWPDEYDDIEYISAATPVNSDARDAYDADTLDALYGRYVPAEHLSIRDVWNESWDQSIGITPPAPVTDAALATDGRRVVAHYFQPHAPYIGRQSLLGHADDENSRPRQGEAVDAPVWQRVKWGDVTRAQLRAAYESNLRRALREVCRLVEETDIERIVVMGDHGEAFGEYGIYAHPPVEHPHTRRVPWGVVTGVREYPDRETTETTDASVESRLEDLGYI
jgi:hypothetical protein